MTILFQFSVPMVLTGLLPGANGSRAIFNAEEERLNSSFVLPNADVPRRFRNP